MESGGVVSRFSGDYPSDWKAIAKAVKDAAGWKCERCGHDHDPATGHTLTVHHLDNRKDNCRDWNLAALCQKCHLHIQGKVRMERVWMFEHSEWFKWRAAGYYAFHAGLPDDRESIEKHMDEYLAIGQGVSV